MAQDYVGSYRLLSLLGTGRTCQVWDAMHDARRERRALKLVMTEHPLAKEQASLLKHEFAVGRGLDHPNIIKVFEFFSERGDTYLVMELFPAPNLKQLIQEGVDRVAFLVPQIIEQGALALEYLHQQGWVHRDVKPDNFLVSETGHLKLIDFALAERKKGAIGKLFSLKGKVQGTRSYMSPEQIRGKPVDGRADVYSFGCLVHELLSGKPPFTGVNTNELLMKHLKSPPPSLEASARNVTAPFAQLVRRMMAKNPKDRPDTLAEVLRQLRALNIFKTAPAPPAASA